MIENHGTLFSKIETMQKCSQFQRNYMYADLKTHVSTNDAKFS